MKNQVHKQFYTTITDTLSKCSSPLHKWRRNFVIEVLLLFMSIPSRVCFLQLARYSKFGEQRFRQQFEKKFDFMDFNSQIETVQSPPTKTLTQMIKSLLDWYLYVIESRIDRLLEISNIIVADAYFSKFPFVQGVMDLGFHLVSRLQNNADLKYIYKGEPK